MQIFAVLLGAAVAAASPQGLSDEFGGRRIFSLSGYVGDSREDERGIWFHLGDGSRRFRFPTVVPEELETYVEIIAAAAERRVALRVRYDAATARVAAEGYVEYRLCSIAAGSSASFGDEAANCPPSAGAPVRTDEQLLAFGLAALVDQPEAARRILGEALADNRLSNRLRVLAFKGRGEAAETLAARSAWGSPAFDRQLIEALEDYRGWVAASPDSAFAQFAVAKLLSDLGGFPEAMAVYDAIGRRWPEHAATIAVLKGAVHRRQGNYPEALRELDEFVAREGPQAGMRFHYHRGWTLNLLGRYEEALVEFGRGLESQPDYPYAYALRSCSYARLGRLAEALRDQERMLELFAGQGPDASPWIAGDTARSRLVVEELRSAVAARSSAPTSLPCEGFWALGERSRSRSPLLDRLH